jgi:hypothetical protein
LNNKPVSFAGKRRAENGKTIDPGSATIQRIGFTPGVEFMKRLIGCAAGVSVPKSVRYSIPSAKIFWLAKAEEWERCALDEIAFHFRECNLDVAHPQPVAHGAQTLGAQWRREASAVCAQRARLASRFFCGRALRGAPGCPIGATSTL